MRAAEEYYLRQRIEKENQVKIERSPTGTGSPCAFPTSEATC